MTTPAIKPVAPFTIGASVEESEAAGNASKPGASDPNAALPAGAPPPELVEAEQARTTAEMELDATKNEASQKDKMNREQVALSTAIRPVQRQTEHQLAKVTKLRERIKGDGPKPRGRVFALNKIASLLEKSAGSGGWPSNYTTDYKPNHPSTPKTPAPSFESSFEPTMYNNREMALDEADSIYGDQTAPITSGADWARKGIQGREQQNAQMKQQMGYSADSSNLRDAWNRYGVAPWQYAAGNLADLGQNMWAGAGKNLGANHMAAKAGLGEMYNQAVQGGAASTRSWPGKIIDGLANVQTDSLVNYVGDTARTVGNIAPIKVPWLGQMGGYGMFQDPRQRQRDAAAEAAAAKAEAAPSKIAPAVYSESPTNFGDLTQALLPFLGMNNQYGGYDGYGGQRPDHSGNFIELMRVLGNMNRGGGGTP